MNERNMWPDSNAFARRNRFFSNSPYKSWRFLTVVLLFGLLVVADLFLLTNYRARLSGPLAVWLFFMVYVGGFAPLLRAVQRHEQIRELYLTGKINSSLSNATLDVILTVAEHAMNDGLFYTLTTQFAFIFYVWHCLR